MVFVLAWACALGVGRPGAQAAVQAGAPKLRVEVLVSPMRPLALLSVCGGEIWISVALVILLGRVVKG